MTVKEKLEIAVEALACISSKHKPRHDKVEYWMGLRKEAIAEVVATDTKIARNALAAIFAGRDDNDASGASRD